MRYFAVAVPVLALVLAPGVCPLAFAQGTLSDVVGFLVTNQDVRTADFEKDRAASEAARDTISRSLLVNLASVPLATSSSGFLYRLNPQLGTVERVTESFGGFFVERALTQGKGRSSFGVSTTTTRFDRLDGQRLRDGSLVTVANRFRDEQAAFDSEALTLNIRSTTTTVFGSVGISDRLEVGAAVPFVRLTLDGRRINTYRGSTLLQASATGTASGIADVAVRAKYSLLATGSGGLAAGAELRLPTGDDQNLLGAGSTSIRLLAIGSYERARIALHGNAAVVRGGISREWSVSGGASFAARPRLTLSTELLARHVDELREIAVSVSPHPAFQGVDTFRLSAASAVPTLTNATFGVKWNVSRTLVIGGGLLWALAKGGLTAPLTPSLAIEYGF